MHFLSVQGTFSQGKSGKATGEHRVDFSVGFPATNSESTSWLQGAQLRSSSRKKRKQNVGELLEERQ